MEECDLYPWLNGLQTFPGYFSHKIFSSPPTSKKGEKITLLLSLCLSVDRLVHQQFPCIFFAEVAHLSIECLFLDVIDHIKHQVVQTN